jgi:hypothetical protein
MNGNLLDPKYLMLAGVVILVIAVVGWLFVEERRSTTAALRQKFGPWSERKAEAKPANRQGRKAQHSRS